MEESFAIIAESIEEGKEIAKDMFCVNESVKETKNIIITPNMIIRIFKISVHLAANLAGYKFDKIFVDSKIWNEVDKNTYAILYSNTIRNNGTIIKINTGRKAISNN